MPPLRGFGGGPNNIPPQHYQQYQNHSQHASGLPPPALGGNMSFMNPNSNANPFAVNGNALSMAQGFGGSSAQFGGGAATGLGSQAAQIGFAHGAALQQQAHNGMNDQGSRGMVNKGRIREVWKGNLQEEMDTLRRLVDKYPYISMDTEFPGVVARPMGSFRGKSDYHYQTLRTNVDLLKLIQLGITVFSEDGETTPLRPQSSDSGIDMAGRKYGNGTTPFPSTWQFNFRFSLRDDMYSQASIESLTQAGVDFVNHERDGIDPFEFGALLISSGLVCDEDVKWISFHGGYDFGYLTKLMICKPLPDDEVEFDMLMRKFFPSIYDVKFLMKHATRLQSGPVTPLDPVSTEILAKFEQKSSLEHLAELLKVKRVGHAHQGGSDALLTGKVFFQMRERIYNGEIHEDMVGKVWGLGFPEHGGGPGGFSNSTPQHYNQASQDNTTPGQNGAYNTPSTPNNGHAGLVSTPSAVNSSGAMAPSTPAGGAFGSFQYAK